MRTTIHYYLMTLQQKTNIYRSESEQQLKLKGEKIMKANVMNMKHERIGKNVFGEICVTKFLKLDRETALEQYVEMMNDITSHHGKIEYTVDSSCFSIEEAKHFFENAQFLYKRFINPYC